MYSMTEFFNDQEVEAIKWELCQHEIYSSAHADLLIQDLEGRYDWVAVNIALEELGGYDYV